MSDQTQEDILLDKLLQLQVTGPGAGHVRLKNIIVVHEIKQGLKKSLLGLDALKDLPSEQVLAAIAGITCCSSQITVADGPGYINAKATLNGLAKAAAKLAEVCAKHGNILLATGHPGSMIGFYLELAKLIRKLGGNILLPAAGYPLKTYLCGGCQLHDITEQIDYIGDVAVVSNGEGLLHTHDAGPMEQMLSAMAADNHTVDLVIADHGFAGAAIKANVAVIAVMDTNDAAIAASRLLGYDPVIIPMDDNRPNYIAAKVAGMIGSMLKQGS